MAFDVYIITVRIDRRMRVAKDEIIEALGKLGFDIVRIERVRRWR